MTEIFAKLIALFKKSLINAMLYYFCPLSFMAKKSSNIKKISILIFGIFFILSLGIVYLYYAKIYFAAVTVKNEGQYLFVRSNWDRNDLTIHLHENSIIQDTSSFIWVCEKKGYKAPKPGRYLLKNGMSNNALVNLLRSGEQVPVKVSFHNIRYTKDLAGVISKQIEADSLDLLNLLNSEQMAEKYGFNRSTFFTMFIPNSYEFYWNTSAEGFISRMAKEYKSFWNPDRIEKLNKLGLKQSEVVVLASIVQAEQSQNVQERPKVAGLYINRLKKGMKLQSDPTLIYALGDYSIRRVLNVHKKFNSKYNTYLYAGLPPGPINLPEINSIDAVLNFEKHNFIYMCAKDDFSGYHNFSSTLSQHNHYARQFQRELNRRKILR